MKKTILFCILFVHQLNAQITEQNYSFLKPKDPIPQEVLKDVYEHLEQNMDITEGENIKKSDKKKIQKTYLNYSYAVNLMFTSGYILFNDTVTNYLNHVLNYLLKNDPELRSKLRIYTVRSEEINAFTTNNGSIFINLGLLASCQSETQLAYILCHEISHYVLKHSLKDILFETESNKKDKRLSQLKKLLKESAFSQEQEFQADINGLNLFLKSPYNADSIENIFDVFETYYSPFGQDEFKLQYFETKNYKFPDYYTLKDFKPKGYYAYQERLDTFKKKISTHPASHERKDTLKFLLQGKSKSGASYALSKEVFDNIQQIARFEVITLTYNNYSFYTAIYEAYSLLQQYPQNLYLKKMLTMSLMKLCEMSASKRIVFIGSETEYDGEMDKLMSLMKRMELNPLELFAFAITYATECLKMHPQDPDLLRMRKKMLQLQKNIIDFNPDLYYTVSKSDSSFKKSALSINFNNRTNNYFDHKNTNNLNNENPDTIDYWRFAFVDYFKDASFKSEFDESAPLKSKRSNKKSRYSSQINLGIQDSLFLCSPAYGFYTTALLREKSRFKLNQTVKRRKELSEIALQSASILYPNIPYIDRDNLAATGADRLNQLYWYEILISNSAYNLVDNYDPFLTSELIHTLESENRSKHIFYSTIYETRIKRRVSSFLGMVLFFPFLPITLPNYINSTNYLFYDAALFNLENGVIEFSDSKTTKSKGNGGVIHGYYFNNFYQIHQSRNKK